MSNYQLQKGQVSHDEMVALSTQFIDRFMPEADGTYVKIYLLGLRQCFAETKLNQRGIAAVLGILESDVMRAWQYWASKNVVSITQSEHGEPDISFLDISQRQPIPVPIPSRPNYTSKEIYEFTRQHTEVQEMFHAAEQILNKTLSTNDQAILYSFYDWLRLPLNIIPMLLLYCVSIQKKSMHYIEKVAIDWAEKEITTPEKADRYLKYLEESHSKISAYKRAMGIFDRALQDSEMEFMKEWAFHLKSPVELVKLACEITVLNTGKISLPYMNKILQDWYSKGIHTVAAARAIRADFKKQTEAKTKNPVQSGTKFNNFSTGQAYDYEALEQAAMDVIRRANKPEKKE